MKCIWIPLCSSVPLSDSCSDRLSGRVNWGAFGSELPAEKDRCKWDTVWFMQHSTEWAEQSWEGTCQELPWEKAMFCFTRRKSWNENGLKEWLPQWTSLAVCRLLIQQYPNEKHANTFPLEYPEAYFPKSFPDQKSQGLLRLNPLYFLKSNVNNLS